MGIKRIPREFLGAFKEGHRFAAREFIDDDLSHELLNRARLGDKEASEALAFYAKFNNEFYKVVFKKDGSDLNYSKQEESDRNKDRYRRSCDVQRFASRCSSMDGMEVNSGEDALIALLDIKKEMGKSEKQ